MLSFFLKAHGGECFGELKHGDVTLTEGNALRKDGVMHADDNRLRRAGDNNASAGGAVLFPAGDEEGEIVVGVVETIQGVRATLDGEAFLLGCLGCLGVVVVKDGEQGAHFLRQHFEVGCGSPDGAVVASYARMMKAALYKRLNVRLPTHDLRQMQRKGPGKRKRD